MSVLLWRFRFGGVIDMTIDEGIAHAREAASEQKRRSGICVQNNSECDKFSACLKCSKEHEQLAEWLEELKSYRASVFSGYMTQKMLKEEYNKAIDDLIAECENAKFAESDEISLSDVHTGVNSGLSMAIHFAEQLKVGDRENGK